MKEALYLYELILKAIKEDDDEVAHIKEDALRKYALSKVIENHPEYMDIVKIAVSTETLDFSRWCA